MGGGGKDSESFYFCFQQYMSIIVHSDDNLTPKHGIASVASGGQSSDHGEVKKNPNKPSQF